MNRDYQVKCPVCGMEIKGDENVLVYQQMRFVFCSEQCKTRFSEHPHLYIGYPGQKAPKQEGQVVLKRRRMHLAQALDVEEAGLVQELLAGLMGVDQVIVSGDTIEVTYDLLQVGLKELEGALHDVGAQLGGDWIRRLQHALIHESEEWQLDGREAVPPHRYHP